MPITPIHTARKNTSPHPACDPNSVRTRNGRGSSHHVRHTGQPGHPVNVHASAHKCSQNPAANPATTINGQAPAPIPDPSAPSHHNTIVTTMANGIECVVFRCSK